MGEVFDVASNQREVMNISGRGYKGICEAHRPTLQLRFADNNACTLRNRCVN
jgi:hypothetical protein